MSQELLLNFAKETKIRFGNEFRKGQKEIPSVPSFHFILVSFSDILFNYRYISFLRER